MLGWEPVTSESLEKQPADPPFWLETQHESISPVIPTKKKKKILKLQVPLYPSLLFPVRLTTCLPGSSTLYG